VVAIIEPRVYEAEVRRVARRPIEHLGCYDLYLRAAPLRASCQKADVTRALEYLDRALALDPNFAPVLAQAAGCHSQMFLNGWGKDREWHRREGLALAERAIRAGSEDAAVLAQAANALMDLESNVNRAIELVDRATSLNPSCARAWFVSGVLRLAMGDGDRALEHFRTAGRLDPISPLNEAIRVHMGIGRISQGETSEALRQIRATSYRTPRIHLMLAALYGHVGKNQERRGELEQYHNCSNTSVADTIAASVHSEKIAIWLRKGLGLAG
jgi:tetratricopeptide (TPR) repeat protein